MVTSMAAKQQQQGQPLTPDQLGTLRTHLMALYSGPMPPPQQQLIQHAASLLRAFASGGPLPPIPTPATYTAPPAVSVPALPGGGPGAPRPAAPQAAQAQLATLQLALAAQRNGQPLPPALAGMLANIRNLPGGANLLAAAAATQLRPPLGGIRPPTVVPR